MSNQVMKVDIFVFLEISKKIILCSPFTELELLQKREEVSLSLFPNMAILSKFNKMIMMMKVFFSSSNSGVLQDLWSVHLPFQFEYIYHLTYAAFTQLTQLCLEVQGDLQVSVASDSQRGSIGVIFNFPSHHFLFLLGSRKIGYQLILGCQGYFATSSMRSHSITQVIILVAPRLTF